MKEWRLAFLYRPRASFAFGALLWSATTCAQSNVTLYGSLDSGFIYTNKTIDDATGKNSGKQFSLINSGMEPSLFGMRGVEDLGGGLAAKFDLESGISVANGGFDNSNGNLFGRQAWISLASPYGEVKLGNQYSPFLFAMYDTDPRSFSQFGSAIGVYANNSFTGTYVSNAVSYKSPKIAGFTVDVMMALGGVAGNFKAGLQYSASLKYEFGGLLLNAAIEDEASSTDGAVNTGLFTSPVVARTFGATYRFASVNVKASFTNFNAPLTFNNGIRSGGDNNIYNLGADYYVLPTLDLNGGVWYVKDQHDSKSHSLIAAIGAVYSLSKRTSLYVQAGVLNNQGTENFGLAIDGALYGARGTTVGTTLGVVHKF